MSHHFAVLQQADLPAGVVNIVPGPSDIGMHLVSHPDGHDVLLIQV